MGNIASKCFTVKKKQSSDTISDLPDDILYHILSFLSIKSIAQTSVLARRWGYIWASIPVLDFSKACPQILIPEAEVVKQTLDHEHSKAMKFITSLLSRRHENYNIKVFRVYGHLSFSRLNNLIRLLVNHRVVEPELYVLLSDSFEFPECLFECDSLRSLTLQVHSPYYWKVRNLSRPYFGLACPCVLAKRGLRLVHTLSLANMDFSKSADLGNVDLFYGSNHSLVFRKCS
ncbi:putative F-box domain-containing protein [Rosa chinensis]|uniref:Putative F-box domain-containing protein n=1 Tax=Rosa chinensis TaxID=74649 RepID=A0A2P6RIA8_ROSCH|nr:putative F-box domain-containing protein [Rosa chinensis]